LGEGHVSSSAKKTEIKGFSGKPAAAEKKKL